MSVHWSIRPSRVIFEGELYAYQAHLVPCIRPYLSYGSVHCLWVLLTSESIQYGVAFKTTLGIFSHTVLSNGGSFWVPIAKKHLEHFVEFSSFQNAWNQFLRSTPLLFRRWTAICNIPEYCRRLDDPPQIGAVRIPGKMEKATSIKTPTAKTSANSKRKQILTTI